VSFILDALRKSESERQRLGATGIADLPLGRRHAQPWWIIGIGILLVANLALLAVVMLRPRAESGPVAATNTQSNAAATARSTAVPVPPSTPAPLTSSLADAAAPPHIEYETVDRETMEAASAPLDGPTLVRSATHDNLPPDSLPTLRLDMHVYSSQRNSRFVMINMRKYLEGQVLQEGPTVEHISDSGVMLSYQGKSWEIDRP